MAVGSCSVCNKTISANKLTCNTHSTPPPTGDGVLEILNVGAGDVKITFDKADIQETIRARRIVSDMIRRGYALIVEVERDGQRAYERVQSFDEAKGEYIIADFDPSIERPPAPSIDPPKRYSDDTMASATTSSTDLNSGPTLRTCARCGKPKHRGRCSRSIPMEMAKATAVGRSAGG